MVALLLSPVALFPGPQFVLFYGSSFAQLIISWMPVTVKMAKEEACSGASGASIAVRLARDILILGIQKAQ